jgi:hypothetical protein
MNEQQFLRECGKPYPEAIAAMAHFRQLVQQQFDPVARKRTKELGKILSVSYDDLIWKEYAYPWHIASSAGSDEPGWQRH